MKPGGAGFWQRWRRDRAGNVLVLFAGALPLFMATSALGVDAGTMFLEKRRLQGVADAAALAAATDVARAGAEAQIAVDINRGANAVTIRSLETGRYAADPMVAPDQRFRPGAAQANAARVTIVGTVPTFFARAFTSQRQTTIVARATAARVNLAAISIGARVAGVSGGLANAILSALAGTELGLTALDYNGLAYGEVDVLRVADAVRASLDLGSSTLGDAVAARITLRAAVDAAASGATDAATAARLRAIAAKVPERTISLGDIIDLGPLGATVRIDPNRPVRVGALSMLRALLEIGAAGRQATASSDMGIPGLGTTDVQVQVGERTRHSPWMMVGPTGGVTVRTAQTRLLIRARIGTALPLGLANITLPLFVELAPAEARLTALSCAAGRGSATAGLTVTPSLGRIAIADVDPSRFADLAAPAPVSPAQITGSLLVRVFAFADIQLGGMTAQEVTFDTGDIAGGRSRTVTTNDLARGITTSLMDRTTFDVRVLGLGVNTGLVSAAVGNGIAGAATPLDQLIDQVTAMAGVRLGQADVWVNSARCGTPTIVG